MKLPLLPPDATLAQVIRAFNEMQEDRAAALLALQMQVAEYDERIKVLEAKMASLEPVGV